MKRFWIAAVVTFGVWFLCGWAFAAWGVGNDLKSFLVFTVMRGWFVPAVATLFTWLLGRNFYYEVLKLNPNQSPPAFSEAAAVFIPLYSAVMFPGVIGGCLMVAFLGYPYRLAFPLLMLGVCGALVAGLIHRHKR